MRRATDMGQQETGPRERSSVSGIVTLSQMVLLWGSLAPGRKVVNSWSVHLEECGLSEAMPRLAREACAFIALSPKSLFLFMTVVFEAGMWLYMGQGKAKKEAPCVSHVSVQYSPWNPSLV